MVDACPQLALFIDMKTTPKPRAGAKQKAVYSIDGVTVPKSKFFEVIFGKAAATKAARIVAKHASLKQNRKKR